MSTELIDNLEEELLDAQGVNDSLQFDLNDANKLLESNFELVQNAISALRFLSEVPLGEVEACVDIVIDVLRGVM